MKLTNYDKAAIIIILAVFALSFYLYPNLPDKIPTHWNGAGEIDGWGAPWTIFLLPITAVLTYALFLIMPSIAVFRKNIKSFKHFNSMKLVIVLFFALIYAFTLLPVFNYDINITQLIFPTISIFLIYFGVVIPTIERNFFIGIRTPWTLASDHVWKKTHQLGGKLFIIAGIIMFFFIFVPYKIFIWLLLIKIFALIFLLFTYSYIIWKKEGKKKDL